MAEFLASDEIDFAAYLRDTDHKTKVRPAAFFISDAKARLRTRAAEKRIFLPWPKCNDSFEFRAGEVTIWAGQNGHGKTKVTTQVALSLVGQGERVCVASFETKPVKTIGNMVRMFSQTNTLAPDFQTPNGLSVVDAIYDEFDAWTTGSLWLYDQTGTAHADVVLGMVKYCAEQLGITHVFIDNLMKCVKDEDDYNGQKEFIDCCCALAKDHGIHIHVVHHLKKPPKEGLMPDKSDVKGSGAITDQVDNLFLVYRNKDKEEENRTRGDLSMKKMEADCYLLLRKQRGYEGEGDDEPKIALWLHRSSGQFVATDGDPAQFFPNYPHHPS